MIRWLVADDAYNSDLPKREIDEPLDFSSPDYDSFETRL